MSDIVSRLRRWTHAVDATPASDLMDEAADEIARLLAAGDRLLSLVVAVTIERDRLRLTDAEQRLLLRLSQGSGSEPPGAITNRALTERDRAILRGLLERLGGGK